MPAAKPLVSVITIFLNADRFLAEAVESVLAQTYDHWELLLVDDGSTDGSTQIARSFAREHAGRIRYLEHPAHHNRGMSASRNLGISAARGEYIAFLDGDDVFLPSKLAEQVAILESNPEAAMTYGRALLWHSWTGNPEDLHSDHQLDLGVPPNTLVPPPTLFHLLLQNRAQTPIPSNTIVRREVVQNVGGFEDEFRGMYEDQVFFLKVHLHHSTFVSDACWLKYRQHPASCTARASRVDYHAARRPMMEWLSGYLARQGTQPASAEFQAVRRELWAARHPGLRRWRARLGVLPQRARRIVQRFRTAPADRR